LLFYLKRSAASSVYRNISIREKDGLMTGGMKLAAIGIIWLAFTIIMTSGTSPVSGADGASAVWLTTVLALAAGGSTLAIAVGGD
jgi:hypothetical protein